MADASAQARFRYHAKQLLIALRHVGNRDPSLGIHGDLCGLKLASENLGIPTPIEIETIPYPEGEEPSNPFLSDCLEGRCVIRYPDGSGEEECAAHARGVDLLVDARQSAIVALEQWLNYVEQLPAKAAAIAARPKHSTERGEGRTKLISALTKHHQYANGGCLNLEPTGNNKLAKAAGVSRSTASLFFTNEFKGHTKYGTLCRDSGRLAGALKLLNNEFAPHVLYGGRPADEGNPDDDE